MLEYATCRSRVALDLFSMAAQVFVFFHLARMLDAGAIPALKDYPGGYFPFVLIGIALAGFQSAALESFACSISREQGAGTLETIEISPTSLLTVVLCGLLWTSVAVLARLGVYLAAGLALFPNEFSRINPGSAAVVLFLTMSSLSGLGLVSAGMVLVLKRADPVGYAFNGLTRLLSGVYFPAALLPAWLKGLSFMLPLTYSLEAMRKAVLNGAGIQNLGLEISFLAGFSALMLPLGLAVFTISLKTARKTGALAFQ